MNGLKAARTARGWSQARVIHEMQRHAAAAGVPIASPDSLKTQLSRWENGHRMPDAVHRQILRAVFGMTDDQLGFTSPAGNTTDHVVGLVFPDNWQAGITSAADLWQGDMDRRDFLRGSAFVSAAFSTPVLHFLVSGDDSSPASDVGNRLVGQPDVDSIREMTRAFRTLDNRHGGGCVRETVVRYLHAEVAPLLRDGRFTASVGAALFSATAELTQLAGWMAYDVGRNGLSQRYLVQALNLAKAGGDRSLGAEVLAAMSHQATYLGDGAEAVHLARAAGRTAEQVGVQALAAEAAVMEAHGHARRGDEASCAKALSRAEATLDRADRAGEPQWMTYFDEAYLAAKFGHCFRDLGQPAQAERFARRSLDMDNSYVRGRAFNLALLAHSHAQQGDVEQACAVGLEAVDVTAELNSARAVQYLADLRAQLKPYEGAPAITQLDERLQPLLGAAA